MVYVDDMRAPFGRMIMCHMIADTRAELLDMAAKIGVQARWIQQKGTNQEHFDVALSARAKAVRAGAKEITLHELAEMTYARRTWTDEQRAIYLGAGGGLAPAPTDD